MINDFIYNNPSLYDQVFPDRRKAQLVRETAERFSVDVASSLIEFACGTGRDLAEFSRTIPVCYGFDLSEKMAEYAKQNAPNATINVGDMRRFNAGRTFDIVCALGASINFALTYDDIITTITNYRHHCRVGGILFIQFLHVNDFFGTLRMPTSFRVHVDREDLIGIATYSFDPIKQLISRHRIWNTPTGSIKTYDNMTFRVIFPDELSYLLNHYGFQTLDIFEREGGHHYPSGLFIVARAV